MFLVLICDILLRWHENDGALTVQSGQWVQRVPRTSESDQFRIHGFDNCLVPTPNGGVAMEPSCFCGVRGVRTETTAALLGHLSLAYNLSGLGFHRCREDGVVEPSPLGAVTYYRRQAASLLWC